MFNVLTGIAMGIVIFAITIGVGSVVLTSRTVPITNSVPTQLQIQLLLMGLLLVLLV